MANYTNKNYKSKILNDTDGGNYKSQSEDISVSKKNKKGMRFLAWQYAKEMWADHKVWKQMVVLKGGIGIITTGILLVPTILSMPFLIGASIVATSGVLMSLALFSVGYGAVGLWNSLKNINKKVKNNFNNEAAKKTADLKNDNISLADVRLAFQNMLLKKWPLKQIANSSPVRAMANSGPWKKFTEFMRESDNLLDSLTIKNSVAGIAIMGGILLTTQIVMIPFFMPVAIAAYTIASVGLGIYMIHEAMKGILSSLKEGRENRKKLAQETKMGQNITVKKQISASSKTATVKNKFQQESKLNKKAVNDNSQTMKITKNSNNKSCKK